MVQAQSPSFSQLAGGLRDRVDAALHTYTKLPDGCPVKLREAMAYSLLAPGKRLRPVLALLAAEAVGGSTEAAVPAACAVEMVHAYSLVHDDLPAMDDDDLRRGHPTCHRKFGEAVAILAGDALLTLAFEVLGRDVKPPEAAARCCATLAKAAGAAQMVGGQADDVDGPGAHGGIDALQSIHHRKTGALIQAALELGALAGGATVEQRIALQDYGRRLGLAFQITDDLLDVRSDEAATGKRVGKDADRGKLTFPGLLGVEESVRRAERLTDEACQVLAPWGARADSLQALVRYVFERNR